MRVIFKQTKEDIINFSIYQQLESPERRHFKWLIQFLPSIIFFLLIWVVSPFPEYDLSIFPIGVIVAVVIVGISPVFFMTFLMKRLIILKNEKFLNDDENKILIGQRILQPEPEGVVIVTESSQGIIEWKDVNKLRKINDYFLIYLNKDSALIIPEKAFETSEHYEQFRARADELFGQYVSRKKNTAKGE